MLKLFEEYCNFFILQGFLLLGFFNKILVRQYSCDHPKGSNKMRINYIVRTYG